MLTYEKARAILDFTMHDALAPGDVVAPGVRLEEEIAVGGMGTVWRAKHERLGIDVAVKVLSPDRLDDPGLTERFQTEAISLARVKSANVVRVIDHGLTERGVPFVVTELLAGEDLSVRLRGGPLQIEEVATLLVQAVRGLTAAHKEGIIHRDIKPSNLFLAQEDEATVLKLIDFGVAKTHSPLPRESTQSGGIMLGTPLYMSPEQLTSPKHVDERSDLWSLAVVAYESLTGQLPFAAETVGALAVLQDRRDYARPSSIDARLSAFDPWFARAFEPQREKRFATAPELGDAFVALTGKKGWIGTRRARIGAATALFVACGTIAWLVPSDEEIRTATPEPSATETVGEAHPTVDEAHPTRPRPAEETLATSAQLPGSLVASATPPAKRATYPTEIPSKPTSSPAVAADAPTSAPLTPEAPPESTSAKPRKPRGF